MKISTNEYGSKNLEMEPIGLNLDDMSTDPDAFFILGHNLYQLSHYANLKGEAMKVRLAGKIETALKLEKEMEEIYEGLADWARW